MAEKGNLSNSRLKRVIDMRWCVDYLILGGVSVMRARRGGTQIAIDAEYCQYTASIITNA